MRIKIESLIKLRDERWEYVTFTRNDKGVYTLQKGERYKGMASNDFHLLMQGAVNSSYLKVFGFHTCDDEIERITVTIGRGDIRGILPIKDSGKIIGCLVDW